MTTSSNMLRDREHGVPHDLILDILGNLPVKSLMRFKSVSKQWFRSIIDPDFTDRHLSNQKKKDPGFVAASSLPINYFQLASQIVFIDSLVVNREKNTISNCRTWLTDIPFDYYTMLNTCDGILCFTGLTFKVFVFNLGTKEYRLLPRIGQYCSKLRLGFCRDVVTKRHKIVSVFNPSESPNQHRDVCLVFTFDQNPDACWRSIGDVPCTIDFSSNSVHVNGAIYWFTDNKFHHKKNEVIVMFDLHTEKFQPIPHPSCCSDNSRWTMQLGTLRECLSLAQQDQFCPEVVNIWKMEKQEQKMSWEKLYCIHVCRTDLWGGLRFAFAEQKDGTLLVGNKGNVYLYKPNGKDCYVAEGYRGKGVHVAFTESLVPIYGETFELSRLESDDY